MNAIISHALPVLFGLVLKTTLLLVAACIACLCLRRASAAMRHLVWAAALGGVLLLPVLSLSLPRWNVALARAAAPPAPMPLAAVSIPTSAVSTSSPSQGTAPAAVPEHTVLGSDTAAVGAPEPAPLQKPGRRYMTPIALAASGLVIWFAGFLVVIGQFLIGLYRIGQIEKRAVPLDEAALVNAEEVRNKLGIRPVVFLRAAEPGHIAIPVTWGLWKPKVLFPAQSSVWPTECLRAALLHEMAHVQRGDWAAMVAARFACALYWWHPLVWLAARQARAESERACDDLVLGTGMSAADYAQRLVEVVRSMPGGASPRTVAIAMAQPSELAGRVQAVLAQGCQRGRRSQRSVIATVLAFVIILGPLSALRLTAQTAVNSSQAGASSETVKRHIAKGILIFVYLKDAECQSNPGNPIQIVDHSVNDNPAYTFTDKRTGKTFRDIPQLKAAFAAIVAQGFTKRPGASLFYVPGDLIFIAGQNTVYFTDAQQQAVKEIGQELKELQVEGLEWSPIISDADIEPTARAIMSQQIPSVPVVRLTFTPEGTKKFADYTTAHLGEKIGIFVDGGLISAPMMMEPILDGKVELPAGFHSLADAQKLAQRLNTPSGTEEITPTSYHSESPNGFEILQKGGKADTVPVVHGYNATLQNGYTISVLGVTKAKANGRTWSLSKGVSWAPNGLPLSHALWSDYDANWNYPSNEDNGIAPFVFKFIAVAPRSNNARTAHLSNKGDASTYYEFLNTANPPDEAAFRRSNENITGDGAEAYFPQTAQSCALRVGIADGAWTTIAALPFHLTPATVKLQDINHPDFAYDVMLKLDDKPALTYQDMEDHPHVEYFLGKSREVGNVARRLVVVDQAGQIIPLEMPGGGYRDWRLCCLSFSQTSRIMAGNPTVNLAHVKEFLLQTRPYQIVEFRNIHLQPTAETVSELDSDEAMAGQATQYYIVQAKLIRMHLQPWAQANKALLQQMVHAKPGDLAALLQVRDSLSRLPFPLWHDDPRVGYIHKSPSFSVQLTGALTVGHLLRAQDGTNTGIRDDFARYHDLRIAESINFGRIRIFLWASGRITQATTTSQFMGHGKPIKEVESQQEIVPAFYGKPDSAQTSNAERLRQAQILAGLTSVRGPGIVVTLSDSKKPRPPKMSTRSITLLIHDTDINQVINQLKAAGTEALAVNNQRLIATSAVRCAGPTIYVNGKAQSPPYVIRAIGDPKMMEAAVNIKSGIGDQLRQLDPDMFLVHEAQSITLPAFSTDTTLPHIKASF